MSETVDRITFDPDQCGGRSCIRNMRIRVTDVLDLLANGLMFDEILEELPDLERGDIVSAIRFATRRIAQQALARFKARVREMTRCTKSVSLTHLVAELSRCLAGWRGYFGSCETPSILCCLDRRVRRRFRAIVWRQWKRGRTRFAALRRLGVNRHLAAKTAGSTQGPWQISNSPALLLRAARRLLRPAQPRPAGEPGHRLNPWNLRVRNRTHGGVGGAGPRGSPYPDCGEKRATSRNPPPLIE